MMIQLSYRLLDENQFTLRFLLFLLCSYVFFGGSLKQNYMENAVPTYVEQTSPEVSARKKSKKTGGVGTIPTDENYVRNAPVDFPEESHPPRISDNFQPSKW